MGNVVYAACQWGVLTVFAKLGTPEMVGQFALGLAVTAPVIMFANLHLRAVQATDAEHRYRFGDYLALRLITTSLALLTITGICFLAGFREETALVILMVGLAKAVESVSDVFYGLLQQHERMDRIAKSRLIKGPLSLIALGLAVYLTGSVVWGVAGLTLAWTLILAGYDVRNGAWVLASPQTLSGLKALGGVRLAPELRPHWSINRLGGLTRLALPLGFVILISSLLPNVPRYFVQGYLGVRDLGIFAAMAYVIVAGSTVVDALGQSASPRLAKYHAQGLTEAFNVLLFKLLGIGALLGVVGVAVATVAGSEVLTILYGPEYAAHGGVFVCLMVAAGIQYVASFLGYGMTAARYFKAQMPLSVGTAAVMVIACMTFVPYAGLFGAALAMVASAVTMLVGGAAITAYAVRHSREGTRR